MAAPTMTATAVLADVVEHLSEEIIYANDREERLEKWKSLEYFWNLLPNAPSYGRLYARLCLANIMTAVAHTDPYGDEPSPNAPDEKLSLLSPALPLVRWSPEHWQALEDLLVETRNVLLRKDADMLTGANGEADPERAQSDLYQLKVKRLLHCAGINKALAPFRSSLNDQLLQKDSGVKIDPVLLATFGEAVQESFGDHPRAQQALESLLVRGKAGTNTRSHGVSLVPPDDLRAILVQRPFCLANLSSTVERLLKAWTQDVFQEKPTLSKLNYSPGMIAFVATEDMTQDSSDSEAEDESDAKQPAQDTTQIDLVNDEDRDEDNIENESPPKSAARRPKRKRDSAPEVASNLEELKAARQDLQNDGTDPLQESHRIAATAAAAATNSSPKTSALLSRKKSAQRMVFDDSDIEEELDYDDRAHLSAVPPHAKLAKKQKSPKTAQASASGYTKRVRFSDAEKLAIREGFRKHGKLWRIIKAENAIVLKNRTTVQIKDCQRTMEKRGEL